MRLLQFAALAATVAGVYFAQYIFTHTTPIGFLPDWASALFPGLHRLNRWTRADLDALASWVMLLSSLGFGLLAPMWRTGAGSRTVRRWFSADSARSRQSLVALSCASAAAAIGFVIVLWNDRLSPWGGILWPVSLVLLLGAAVMLDEMRAQRISFSEEGRPERGWPWAMLILAAGAFLMAWNGARLPAQLPDESALVALQAIRQIEGTHPLFAYGDMGQSGFASLPLATLLLLGVRPLDAIRWVGILAGVVTLAGGWLMACELFRRRGDSPPADPNGGDGVIDDDGRAPALWALLALAGALPLIHFGRLAGHLEPVACGILALWLLLRGARLGRLSLIAGSGILVGTALMFSPGGLVFVFVAAFLWLGLWLLRQPWLHFAQGGVGGPGATLWLGSLLLTCAPILGAWMGESSRLFALHVDFFAGLQSTASALGLTAHSSFFAAFPASMLNNLIAPLFVLGAVALLFRLDHLVGWTLTLWIVCALMMAALVASLASWPTQLLAALPAAALAIGFALDRIHAIIGYTLGGWTTRAVSYLIVGLLLLAGVNNWVDYAQASTAQDDLATALARSLDNSPDHAPIFLAVDGNGSRTWDVPVVRLAMTGRSQAIVTLDAGDPAGWPAALPSGARVFAPPDLQGVLQSIAQRYPGGVVQTERDLRANPLLFVYAAP